MPFQAVGGIGRFQYRADLRVSNSSLFSCGANWACRKRQMYAIAWKYTKQNLGLFSQSNFIRRIRNGILLS